MHAYISVAGPLSIKIFLDSPSIQPKMSKKPSSKGKGASKAGPSQPNTDPMINLYAEKTKVIGEAHRELRKVFRDNSTRIWEIWEGLSVDKRKELLRIPRVSDYPIADHRRQYIEGSFPWNDPWEGDEKPSLEDTWERLEMDPSRHIGVAWEGMAAAAGKKSDLTNERNRELFKQRMVHSQHPALSVDGLSADPKVLLTYLQSRSDEVPADYSYTDFFLEFPELTRLTGSIGQPNEWYNYFDLKITDWMDPFDRREATYLKYSTIRTTTTAALTTTATDPFQLELVEWNERLKVDDAGPLPVNLFPRIVEGQQGEYRFLESLCNEILKVGVSKESEAKDEDTGKGKEPENRDESAETKDGSQSQSPPWKLDFFPERHGIALSLLHKYPNTTSQTAEGETEDNERITEPSNTTQTAEGETGLTTEDETEQEGTKYTRGMTEENLKYFKEVIQYAESTQGYRPPMRPWTTLFYVWGLVRETEGSKVMVQLREDPAYFQQRVRDAYEHQSFQIENPTQTTPADPKSSTQVTPGSASQAGRSGSAQRKPPSRLPTPVGKGSRKQPSSLARPPVTRSSTRAGPSSRATPANQKKETEDDGESDDEEVVQEKQRWAKALRDAVIGPSERYFEWRWGIWVAEDLLMLEYFKKWMDTWDEDERRVLEDHHKECFCLLYDRVWKLLKSTISDLLLAVKSGKGYRQYYTRQDLPNGRTSIAQRTPLRLATTNLDMTKAKVVTIMKYLEDEDAVEYVGYQVLLDEFEKFSSGSPLGPLVEELLVMAKTLAAMHRELETAAQQQGWFGYSKMIVSDSLDYLYFVFCPPLANSPGSEDRPTDIWNMNSTIISRGV